MCLGSDRSIFYFSAVLYYLAVIAPKKGSKMRALGFGIEVVCLQAKSYCITSNQLNVFTISCSSSIPGNISRSIVVWEKEADAIAFGHDLIANRLQIDSDWIRTRLNLHRYLGHDWLNIQRCGFEEYELHHVKTRHDIGISE